MDMRPKSPTAYRKKFPGRHVVAILVVTPSTGELLLEGPIDEETIKKILALHMKAGGVEDLKEVAEALSP